MTNLSEYFFPSPVFRRSSFSKPGPNKKILIGEHDRKYRDAVTQRAGGGCLRRRGTQVRHLRRLWPRENARGQEHRMGDRATQGPHRGLVTSSATSIERKSRSRVSSRSA